ncbi:MAG: DUF2235 domain-containing protein [Candidatus Parabeggiatoa sp.]|nr:DUF2235 domain-containing protein [Candidatus Parabeggiatoa sp.]
MALYAFDGTWNEEEGDEGKNTNVIKFRDAYTQKNFYLEGIGTRNGFIGKILGGVMGAGGRVRIKEAMEALDHNLAAGDAVIDIIGFSRGAALALHFANQIQTERNGADIRFLGLWDVVASFGIPGNKINIGWRLTLPDNVKKCYHAMALDERRQNFPLTRVQSASKGLSTAGRLQELWFRGVHSDVGGGLSVGLSSIALCWMCRRAREEGLPIDELKIGEYEKCSNADAPISKNRDPQLDPLRKLLPGDAVHESVQPRENSDGIEHNNPPDDVVRVGG